MSEIKLVVFDIAGTTVRDQNEVEACFIEAANKTWLPYEREDILLMMGWSKKKVFEILWAKALPDHPKNELDRLVNESYLVFRQILEDHYKNAEVVPTAHCLEIFEELRRRQIKIALTTGFYREVTNIILNRLGWDKEPGKNYLGNSHSLIDVSVASDEVRAGRPEPDMICRAMILLGITDPGVVINVGDTPSDLQAGKNAGCRYSLGVCNGTHSPEQLAAVPNDGLLQHIGEIRNYI